MKIYRRTDAACVDVSWPKLILLDAKQWGREVRLKLPVGDADQYIIGKVRRLGNTSFTIPDENGCRGILYSAVDSIEILPVESETEAPEGLTEGMWRIEKLLLPYLNIFDISERSSSGVYVFLGCKPLLTEANAKMLIEAHNKKMLVVQNEE